MADEKTPNEVLAAQVAELKKAMEAGVEANKDAIAKMAAELGSKLADEKVKALEQVFEKRQKELVSNLRKGRYAAGAPVGITPELISKSARNKDGSVKDANAIQAQEWNDNVYILSKIMGEPAARDSKIWQKLEATHSELRKAMDSATSGEGLEWIPTDFSADLIDRVRLARKVAALFPEISMPTDPYKLPNLTADSTGYLVPENTSDDPATRSFTASKPTTGNITLNAIKLGIRVNFSLELQEDSIIPVLETLKNNMAIEMASSIEDADINGDTTGTHMDANVTGSTNRKKAWIGLRKAAQAANNTSLATFNLAGLRTMRSKMGKYGVDPSKLAFVCSARGYMKLLAVDEVITLEKYGPNATVLQGELGKIDGISIIVSELLLDDKNTNGVNDATTADKGVIILCYVPGFLHGVKRRITLKSFEDVQNDQVALVTSWRGDFQPIYAVATNAISVAGVNFAA